MYVFSPEELQDLFIKHLNFTSWTTNYTNWTPSYPDWNTNYTDWTPSYPDWNTNYTDWFDALKYDPIFNDDLNFTPPHYNYTLPTSGTVYILNETLCGENGLLEEWLKNLTIDQTSMDTTPPSILSINPTNNSVNVPVSKTIKFTFTEEIKKNTNWIELKNSNGKVISFTTSISGKILTIKPKSKLAESKYTLCIHSGAVTDLAGNPVALKSSKFTTGTPPTVVKSDPKNNAKNIARTKAIKVNFNENIKAGKNYKIELVTKNTKVSIKKSIKNNVLTIKHKDKLKPKTKYTLRLHNSSVTDQAGNPLKAKTITFTTSK